MPDQFEQYYKYLKANGADVAPDFNSFKNTLSNYDNASKYYSYLKENNFDVPSSYDSFADTFGLKKKVGGEGSSLTELPSKGFSPEQISLLQTGAQPPKPSGKAGGTTIIPTNITPDQKAYERELKRQDAAINTLKNTYKQKGLDFNVKSKKGQEQIAELLDKETNNDLTLVTGKDQKPYLVRGEGFLESAGKGILRSIVEPVESTKINLTNDPNELADLLDEKIKAEPNVPESAPTKFGGYLGGLAGGLPKMMALLAIPGVGEAAMTTEMYHNALANQRRTLYERGLQEGMDRTTAAQNAMKNAPITAIPDAVVGAAMARGIGGKAAGADIIPNAAKESFLKATGKGLKGVAKVSGIGGAAEFGRSKAEQQLGYNVTNAEAIENGLRGMGEYAIMDAAFKLAHAGPKYLTSAAKNLLSSVPKEVLEIAAEKYPDGKKTLEDVAKFSETKAKVQDFVPEEKVASVTGLTEKVQNLESNIKELEERKKTSSEALHPFMDDWIKEYQDEINFYKKQIDKVVKSKDETGVSEEIDDITGYKAGEQPEIVQEKVEDITQFPETLKAKKKPVNIDFRINEKTGNPSEGLQAINVNDKPVGDYQLLNRNNKTFLNEVIIYDKELRGKGYGLDAYKSIIDELNKSDKKLYSTNYEETGTAISPQALSVWAKLEKEGYAKKIGEVEGVVKDRQTKTEEKKIIPIYESVKPAEVKEEQIKPIEYAIQEPSASSVLQPAQERVRETGGERKRVEPSIKGEEIAKKGEQAPVYEKEKVKVYNAKDLKENPKILEEDEDYHTIAYPKSFVNLYTNMLSMKRNGNENPKIGDVVNIFKKDYVVEGFIENKKNPDKTSVKLIRVDKDGNLLREQDLSATERKAGKAKEFEEEEVEVEAPEITKEDVKKAESKFAAAKDKFEKAKAKVEATQVKQTGLFGGEQKGMFAMGGEEAKSTLDPLRKAAKEAKAELDNLKNRLKVQEEAQAELAPVEGRTPQVKPLSEFKVGDKFVFATDRDGREHIIVSIDKNGIAKYKSKGSNEVSSASEIQRQGNDLALLKSDWNKGIRPNELELKGSRFKSKTKPSNEQINNLTKELLKVDYAGAEPKENPKSAKDFYEDVARRYLENDLDIVEVVDEMHGGKERLQEIIKGVEPKKTYQEVLKEKQEAEKKQTRQFAGEKAAVTRRIFDRVFKMDAPEDAEQIALRYLADGGKVSKEAVDEAYGTVKRAALNTGRRELLSEEVKSKDFVGGNETLDEIAHKLWEQSGQKIPERDIKDQLMAEIGNNNTRLDAAEAYLEKYDLEYQEEKRYQRLAEQAEVEFLEEQAKLEEELRKPLDEQIEGEASEEHINNLIKQYEAEIKAEDQQLRSEGKGEAGKETGGREIGEKAAKTEAELAKDYKEAIGKASKKAKENAKKEFVDRNFEKLVEKLKIQIKCPT